MYIQQLGEIVPPPSQNTVGVCNHITFVILQYISSRLVTLLKVTDAPIQVPSIFDLTVSFKFINSTHLFVRRVGSEFAELTVVVNFIYHAVILYFLQIFLFVCGNWAER